MTGVSFLGHSPRLGELRAPVQVCGRRGRSLHSIQKIVECTGGPERVAVLRAVPHIRHPWDFSGAIRRVRSGRVETLGARTKAEIGRTQAP